MITGAHVILYSTHAEADRNFIRDEIGFGHVDVGHGWLIFALPPAEVAVHPTDGAGSHELYLMCDDVKAVVADMQKKGAGCAPIQEERWGSLTYVTLPSGAKLGVYQPKHPSPKHAAPAKKTVKKAPKKAARSVKKPASKAARQPAKKSAKPKRKK